MKKHRKVDCMNVQEKMMLIHKLLLEIPFDYLILKFFDAESERFLDKKIKVLEQLKAGKKRAEIEGFYEILELYPKNEEMWD